jgi:hypothetical protein
MFWFYYYIWHWTVSSSRAVAIPCVEAGKTIGAVGCSGRTGFRAQHDGMHAVGPNAKSEWPMTRVRSSGGPEVLLAYCNDALAT